jgi:hypothetical protein
VPFSYVLFEVFQDDSTFIQCSWRVEPMQLQPRDQPLGRYLQKILRLFVRIDFIYKSFSHKIPQVQPHLQYCGSTQILLDATYISEAHFVGNAKIFCRCPNSLHERTEPAPKQSNILKFLVFPNCIKRIAGSLIVIGLSRVFCGRHGGSSLRLFR